MTVVAPVLTAALAVGCGSSSSRLTAGQLVQRASAICLAAGHPYAGQRPTDPAGFLDFLRAQLPAQDTGVKALQALRPPASAEKVWQAQIVTAEREQLADTRAAVDQLQKLLGQHDQGRASALVLQTTDRLDARGVGINQYWTSSGTTSCLDSPL